MDTENKINEQLSDRIPYTFNSIRDHLIDLDTDILRLAQLIHFQSKTIESMSRSLLVIAFSLCACSILWWFR